jgi:chemotaxis protein methyltransferase WspC
MSAIDIERMLRDAMGLDATTIGRDAVAVAVRRRQEQCRIPDTDAYTLRLLESPQELQSLIEAVVVPETWFFRHEEAFHALAEWVHTVWMPAHPAGVLRVLSVPCSTGEEPYSIAMTLLDIGFPADKFVLDAVDISRINLDHASRGVYRSYSFRSRDVSFRDKHFSADQAAYRLSPRVRERVNFRWGNLQSADFMMGEQPYDIVFCRNVLIYFDGEKQHNAVGALKRLLSPSGLLFVGPAEGFLAIDCGFQPLKHRTSFGFHRHKGQPAAKPEFKPRLPLPPVKKIQQPAKPVARPPALTAPVIAPPALTAPVIAPPPVPRDPAAELAKARRCADAGELSAAKSLCEELLQGPDVAADAYTLLGILEEATGDMHSAEESYKRAIYLEPAHEEALAHLALVMDRKGDNAAAKRLRERMKRAGERGMGVPK